MGKILKSQSGFGAIEALLIIIIILLLAGGGYYVYKTDYKKTNKGTPAGQPLAAKSGSSNAGATGTSSESNWANYCSTIGGICISYPSSWHFNDDAGNIATVTGDSVDGFILTSPSGKTDIEYDSNVGQGGWSMPNSAVKIINAAVLKSTSGLESVSSITTDVANAVGFPSNPTATYYQPELFVTTSSSVSSYVTPAQSSGKWTDGYAEVFTNPHASKSAVDPYTGVANQQRLMVNDLGNSNPYNGFTSYSDAQNWLNSSELKEAAQILATVKYND